MFYRLVLCGLLLARLIVGYCQPLQAATLTFEDIQDEDLLGDAPEEHSGELLEDEEGLSEELLEDAEAVQVEEEVNEDFVQDQEDDGEVDLSDQDSSASVYNIDIDYDYLSEIITNSILDAESLTSVDETSYDGSISTSYQSLFAGMYLKLAGPSDDYLLYRADQYTYRLIIGDLTLTNTTFSGDGVTVVSYYTRSNSGYSPDWSVSIDDILVTADLAYSYSNLGDYAPLSDLAFLVYDQQILFLGLFILLFLFINTLIEFRKGE